MASIGYVPQDTAASLRGRLEATEVARDRLAAELHALEAQHNALREALAAEVEQRRDAETRIVDLNATLQAAQERILIVEQEIARLRAREAAMGAANLVRAWLEAFQERVLTVVTQEADAAERYRKHRVFDWNQLVGEEAKAKFPGRLSGREADMVKLLDFSLRKASAGFTEPVPNALATPPADFLDACVHLGMPRAIAQEWIEYSYE